MFSKRNALSKEILCGIVLLPSQASIPVDWVTDLPGANKSQFHDPLVRGR